MAVMKARDPETGQWVPVLDFDSIPNNSEQYFDIDYDGVICLKAEYRGNPTDETFPYAISDMGVGVVGSKNAELPERLVIPDVVDGTAVTAFQAGMFYVNRRIREITLPDAVEAIPDNFCREAVRLKTVRNTNRIKKVGSGGFSYTRVEKMVFPNLEEASTGSFAACCYLYSIDIGNKLTAIPQQMFMQCCLLSVVRGGAAVRSIGLRAFQYTKNLKNLPLLSGLGTVINDEEEKPSIGSYAFFGSRIQFDWASIADNCTFGERATPVVDNTTDFWSCATFVPCEGQLVTRMSQKNAEWANLYCGDSGVQYIRGCALFAALHIHSALSGEKYDHPDTFAEEIRAIDPSFLTSDGWPGKFENVAPLFSALGYKTTVYTDDITTEVYQAMCDALARGAYVYSQISTIGYADSGHAVAIYGINSNGEMLVIDSDLMYEKYRDTGIDDKLYTYRMTYQNLAGPTSNFVVVEKA